MGDIKWCPFSCVSVCRVPLSRFPKCCQLQHTHTHAHIHTYTHTQTHTHIHTYTHTHTHTHTHEHRHTRKSSGALSYYPASHSVDSLFQHCTFRSLDLDGLERRFLQGLLLIVPFKVGRGKKNKKHVYIFCDSTLLQRSERERAFMGKLVNPSA
jgi:hypothetical protein